VVSVGQGKQGEEDSEAEIKKEGRRWWIQISAKNKKKTFRLVGDMKGGGEIIRGETSRDLGKGKASDVAL